MYFEICDNNGQVVFEAIEGWQMLEWYEDLVEEGFDFTGWTADGDDLQECIADIMMYAYA